MTQRLAVDNGEVNQCWNGAILDDIDRLILQENSTGYPCSVSLYDSELFTIQIKC